MKQGATILFTANLAIELNDYVNRCLSPRIGLSLPNHPIRPRQHIWRNREADLLRCLQVDDEIKFCRLFDGQIGRLCSLKALRAGKRRRCLRRKT
jgi:hypothetical protein